jgi:hypothetical protein
MSNSHLF